MRLYIAYGARDVQVYRRNVARGLKSVVPCRGSKPKPRKFHKPRSFDSSIDINTELRVVVPCCVGFLFRGPKRKNRQEAGGFLSVLGF